MIKEIFNQTMCRLTDYITSSTSNEIYRYRLRTYKAMDKRL